jgi:hypothetical protein
MMPQTPPKAVAVEVVATQPTDADDAMMAGLGRAAGRDMAPIVYLVTVRLETIPAATSSGWALYVDDFRVPKYWQYKDGIYFKVYDPEFLADHAGGQLRFSPNGTDFIDTGLTLAPPNVVSSPTDTQDLPPQSDILS